MEEKHDYRLPDFAEPSQYDLALTVDLTGKKFWGTQNIKVKVKKETLQLVINSLDLNFESAKFICSDSESIEGSKFEFNKENQQATITFASKIVPQEGVLSVDFSAELGYGLVGLYLSKYKLLDGTNREMAVTQMEPMDCCRMCPCFDEPNLKAVWNLTIKTHADRTCIANTPASSTHISEDKEWQTIQFEPTPKMSSYLVCICIADLDYVESKTKSGIVTRVYAVPHEKHRLQFAGETSAKCLDFYESWFKVPFPLPKSDAVGVQDYTMGAMENWGLVTYRETLVYVDQNTNGDRKRFVAEVIAHELAHQWFGNLCTMQWWDELWLNEGFATFMEYRCIESVYPENLPWQSFFSSTWTRGIELDALESSHPIHVPVKSALEVNEIFDDISYSKGCCLNRMLHGWLGENKFTAGLKIYFDRHQYSNTTTNDLWQALSEGSGLDVASVAAQWTANIGFPLLAVNSTSSGSSTTLHFSQQRFLASGEEDKGNTVWKIPVTVTWKKRMEDGLPPLSFLIQDRMATFVLLDVSEKEWILINPGSTGFYLVKYEDKLLSSIKSGLKKGEIENPIDRANILFTSKMLLMSGKIESKDAIDITLSFYKEINDCVLSVLYSVVREYDALIQNNKEAQKKLREKVAAMLRPSVGLLQEKMKEGHFMDEIAMAWLTGVLVSVEDPHMLEHCVKHVLEWFNDNSKLSATVRAHAFAGACIANSAEAFEKLYELATSTAPTDPSVKNEALAALALATDPSLSEKALRLSTSDLIRPTDRFYLYRSGGKRAGSNILCYNFMMENYEEIVSKMSLSQLIDRADMIKNCLRFITDEKVASEVQNFFKDRPNTPVAAVKQAVERVQLNVKWANKYMEDLCKAL